MKKEESKAELMLHPVRFRIMQSLLSGQRLTAQEIGRILEDVPQATLYRHINKLVEGGLVVVVDKQQIRGTTEKTFAVPDVRVGVIRDVSTMTSDDLMRTFMMFVASLIDDYDRYLKQDTYDLVADGVSYRKATLYLSDEEFQKVTKVIRETLEGGMKNEPRADRSRRVFSTIIMPEPKKEG